MFSASLPLFSSLLWLGVLIPVRVLFIGQIEQTMCANKWLMLNCYSYIAKKRLVLKCYLQNVFTNHLYRYLIEAWIGVWVNRVSIPATGSWVLIERNRPVGGWLYRYIYSLTLVGLSSLSEWSNRVAISVCCKDLQIWIELSVAVKRMYVNNSNCDS